MTTTKEELQKLTKANLVEMAKEKGIEDTEQFSKAEIIDMLLDDNQSADNQSADNQSADNQSADNQSADNQSADNQSDDNQSADNQSDDNQSADNQSAAMAMRLELAKRQSKHNAGIGSNLGAGSCAFRVELARRSSKYGNSSTEPVTETEVESAMQQELARRSTLKR